jgi:acyl carrier protein
MNFGIDSLAAVGFINTLEEEMNLDLPVEEFLENATVANISEKINQQLSS